MPTCRYIGEGSAITQTSALRRSDATPLLEKVKFQTAYDSINSLEMLRQQVVHSRLTK